LELIKENTKDCHTLL